MNAALLISASGRRQPAVRIYQTTPAAAAESSQLIGALIGDAATHSSNHFSSHGSFREWLVQPRVRKTAVREAISENRGRSSRWAGSAS